MPSACSAEAAAISPMMSVTRCTEATMSCMVAPARCAVEPWPILPTVSSIRPLISLAACALLRQRADLGGDHREALALLARARFHGRVQRQDVGLEGNAVDHRHDVGDLHRAGRDRAHGAHHFRHRGAAARPCPGRRRQLVGLARAVGVLLDGGGQLFHGRRRLFQRRGLLLGARRQVGIAGGDLAQAEAMLSTPARIRATVAARLPFIVCKARISWPISSRERTAMLLVRSLAATVRATASASDSGCVMLQVSSTASSRPLSKPMAPITIIHRLALAYSPWISWARASISARCTLDSFEISSMNCRVAGRNSWANTRSAVATSPSSWP